MDTTNTDHLFKAYWSGDHPRARAIMVEHGLRLSEVLLALSWERIDPAGVYPAMILFVEHMEKVELERKKP